MKKVRRNYDTYYDFKKIYPDSYRDDLVILPRKKYEEFLALEKMLKQRSREEADTDEAVTIYKKEKQQGKLK